MKLRSYNALMAFLVYTAHAHELSQLIIALAHTTLMFNNVVQVPGVRMHISTNVI